MLESDFNAETGTVHCRLRGTVEFNDIVDFINDLSDKANLPSRLKLVVEALCDEPLFRINGWQAIVEANNGLLQKCDFLSQAIIINQPTDTALAFYFKTLSEHPKFLFEVFNTYEAAYDWINLR